MRRVTERRAEWIIPDFDFISAPSAPRRVTECGAARTVPHLDFTSAPPARRDPVIHREPPVVGYTPPVRAPKKPSHLQRRLEVHDRHAATVRASLAKRPVLWLERFPATIILGLQYGLLVVRPAVAHHTEPERLILGICAVGVGVAFALEALAAPIGPTTRRRPRSVTPRAATAVYVVGAVTTVISALLGDGSYAVQIGTASASRAVSLFTPFNNWMLFGLLMMLWLYRDQQVSRRRVGGVLAVTFVLQLGLSLHQGLFAPLLELAIPVVVVGLLARLIRARWILVIVLVATVAAPTLLAVRNDRRQALGNHGGTGATSLGQRLRLDEEISDLRLMPPPPAHIGQPGVSTLLRIGLLPRAIDSNRRNLNTGENISAAIGGTATNSATLTPFGDAYAFSGWGGVVFVSALSTVALAAAVRRRSVWGFVMTGLIVEIGLSIFGTYPDELTEVLQAGESLAVAAVLCALMRSSPERRRGSVGVDIGEQR
jgi:FtsH-binding integral membrane protein